MKCEFCQRIRIASWPLSQTTPDGCWSTDERQSLGCRIRQLEQLLADVLPLAQSVSCVANEHGRLETSCCHWKEVVTRIEAAGIRCATAQEVAAS